MTPKTLLICILTLVSFSSQASETRVIYGEDGRVTVGESSIQKFRDLAHSTAAMVPSRSLEFKFNGLLAQIKTKSLKGQCKAL
jgi:hypothetical protein